MKYYRGDTISYYYPEGYNIVGFVNQAFKWPNKEDFCHLFSLIRKEDLEVHVISSDSLKIYQNKSLLFEKRIFK